MSSTSKSASLITPQASGPPVQEDGRAMTWDKSKDLISRILASSSNYDVNTMKISLEEFVSRKGISDLQELASVKESDIPMEGSKCEAFHSSSMCSKLAYICTFLQLGNTLNDSLTIIDIVSTVLRQRKEKSVASKLSVIKIKSSEGTDVNLLDWLEQKNIGPGATVYLKPIADGFEGEDPIEMEVDGKSQSSSVTHAVKEDGPDQSHIGILRRRLARLQEQSLLGMHSINKMAAENDRLEEEIIGLKEVVNEALKRGQEPLDWGAHIPEDLKQDPSACSAAVRGGHTTWEDLMEEADPIAILAALETFDLLGWEDVPEDLKEKDQRIALFGVKYRSVPPDHYLCLVDHDFIKEQFLEHGLKWSHFPTVFKDSIRFAESMERIPTCSQLEEIFEQFPPLRQEQSFWWKAVDTVDTRLPDVSLSSIIERFAPAEIRSNDKIMSKACSKEVGILSMVDDRLADDQTFLLDVAAQSDGILLEVLAPAHQLRFPDVVLMALAHPGVELSSVAQELQKDADFLQRLEALRCLIDTSQ